MQITNWKKIFEAYEMDRELSLNGNIKGDFLQ